MSGQISWSPAIGGSSGGKAWNTQRTAHSVPVYCSAGETPKRSKDRSAKARPPAPCQSATGAVSWQHFSEFTPNASDYTAQYANEPAQVAEQPEVRQQRQTANGAAVLKINIDLGLVRRPASCG